MKKKFFEVLLCKSNRYGAKEIIELFPEIFALRVNSLALLYGEGLPSVVK